MHCIQTLVSYRPYLTTAQPDYPLNNLIQIRSTPSSSNYYLVSTIKQPQLKITTVYCPKTLSLEQRNASHFQTRSTQRAQTSVERQYNRIAE